jgi:S-adenosylmethionine:tRNA ribosyltransferase-isomerase
LFALTDYAFDLPAELIAQEPAAVRDGSRLLHVDGSLHDLAFGDIVELLPRDAVLIGNDTRVIPARVPCHKDSGGAVELLFLAAEAPDPALGLRAPAHPKGTGSPYSSPVEPPAGTTAWRCLARARRPLRVGQTLAVDGCDLRVTLLTDRAADGSVVVAVPGDGLAFLDAHGHIPLPRYIDRADRASDRERYQTVFARVPGAIAAPTAGLHVTPAILERLAARGVTFATVTLHVGWGTFESIRVDDIRQHHMHAERYSIPEATAALVASGRPIVALGTTAMRALESAAIAPRAVAPGPGVTDLFIYPESGHTFRAVDHLITNFHLPESTLLMLVCAFAGTDRVLAAYRHAVAKRYRFFSYGDAMLVHKC